MQGTPVESVSVYRPQEYRLAPAYKVEVVESATQLFTKIDDALHMDENRMSFSIKSPGLGVILQPQLVLEFRVEITAPGKFDYSQVLGPTLAPVEIRNIGVALGDATYRLGYCPKLAFSSGDAVFKNATSYQVTINGAAVSNHNFNKNTRSLDQCWMHQDVFASRYGAAGGRYAAFDCVPVSGESY